MDSKKGARIDKIISLLVASPDGLWLREIAKKTKIPIATLHRYIESDLADVVDSLGVKDEKGRHFGLRIIRLKPKILDVVESGGIEKLRNFLEMSRKAKEA